MNPAKPTNSAQSSAQHPQLKVVPPKLIPVPKEELTDSQVDSTPSGKAPPVLEPERSERKLEGTENVTLLNPQSQTSKGKGLMVGAIALGLVAVGLVPFDQKVEGPAVIDSAPLERQTIPLHQGYVIEQLGVLHNKEVKAGELVAKVSDEQLLQQLSEVEQKLAQANSEYKLAQQTYSVYLQKQEQAQLSATLAARRTLERKRDIDRINHGLIPEPLLELRQSQATREIELEGIKNQLNQINREIARYEDLVKQGALSKQQWINLSEKD
jgi:multidrug resistance efflux pump